MAVSEGLLGAFSFEQCPCVWDQSLKLLLNDLECSTNENSTKVISSKSKAIQKEIRGDVKSDDLRRKVWKESARLGEYEESIY